MDKKNAAKEKIQKSFDAFFSSFEKETWRPYDFKQYKRSIYNILCTSYKNSDDKIDWEYILNNFVPEDKRVNFRHTNIYNKKGVIKAFKEFFASQKKKGKNTWSVSELDERNTSLVITLSRQYGYQDKQLVDRETFIKDYNLDTLGCTFVRNAPIRTPITIEKINGLLKDVLAKRSKRSPNTLVEKKPQYLIWLGQRYRDDKGKIDWLYILHKVFDDGNIVNRFRHRYSSSRLLGLPARTKNNIQIDQNRGYRDREGLNPEEELIYQDEQKVQETLIQKIYGSIEDKLSDEEKKILFSFLDGDKTNEGRVEEIIMILKNDLEIQK